MFFDFRKTFEYENTELSYLIFKIYFSASPMADLTVSDFDAIDIKGVHQDFSQYAGRVTIIFNAASE